MRKSLVWLVSGLVLIPIASSAQQSMTLSDAVRIALEKNPLHKAALAETRAAQATVKESRSGLWPRLQFSEIATRGNDPVYVFGTKLRQQRFTTADFALNSLNTPTPIGNFSSKFSGQWRLFDSLQNYRSIERTRKMSDASREQLERSDQELIARVVQSYFGVLMAKKRTAVAEGSVKTAEVIEARSRSRVESGMAVDADLLNAQVLVASRRQELIQAQNDQAYALVQLAIALGSSTETSLLPSETLSERTIETRSVAELEREALEKRPDLRRIRSEQSAQEQSVAMAKSAFGPRVDAFGSWQTDSHSLGWNGGNNWTAGIEVQIDLFAGGAKMAQLQREKSISERVTALRTAFENNVKLEVRRAYYDLDAARQQVAVAKAATQQAAESLRIMQNRYESGLTTISDLLQVEDASHRTELEYWNAVYRVQTSSAGLELASGTLNPNSAVVTQ